MQASGLGFFPKLLGLLSFAIVGMFLFKQTQKRSKDEEALYALMHCLHALPSCTAFMHSLHVLPPECPVLHAVLMPRWLHV